MEVVEGGDRGGLAEVMPGITCGIVEIGMSVAGVGLGGDIYCVVGELVVTLEEENGKIVSKKLTWREI